MRELTEHDKALIIDSIPEANLALFYAGIQGRVALLLDRSVNAQHGTMGTVAWSGTPRGVKALKFPGNACVIASAASTMALNFTSGDFSGILALKLSSIATTQMLIRRGEFMGKGWGFFLTGGGSIYFQTFQAGAVQESIADSVVSAGAWCAVGWTRHGTSVRLFKNGADVNTTSGSHLNPTTSTTNKLIMGTDNDESSSPILAGGLITKVAIWSRQLSAAEMLSKSSALLRLVEPG